MISLAVWTLVALSAAALVLVLAGGGNDSVRGGGPRAAWRDMRAGLAMWRTRGTVSAAAAADPEPVDATMAEFFAAAEVDDDGYLQLEELTDTLNRARELASRGVDRVRR
jgi:hypothetical protein